MRSGNYKAGQRKVIFTLQIRLEHWCTNIPVSALFTSSSKLQCCWSFCVTQATTCQLSIINNHSLS